MEIAKSFREKVKAEALLEVEKEIFDKAKIELKSLYRKLELAKKAVKNIENEITDYEMEIQGE